MTSKVGQDFALAGKNWTRTEQSRILTYMLPSPLKKVVVKRVALSWPYLVCHANDGACPVVARAGRVTRPD